MEKVFTLARVRSTFVSIGLTDSALSLLATLSPTGRVRASDRRWECVDSMVRPTLAVLGAVHFGRTRSLTPVDLRTATHSVAHRGAL